MPPLPASCTTAVRLIQGGQPSRTAGRLWDLVSSAADQDWRSICWAPELGLLVAVGQSGTGNRVMTSANGLSWTLRASAADLQWSGLCWAPELGQLVAVAQNGTGSRVMVSA